MGSDTVCWGKHEQIVGAAELGLRSGVVNRPRHRRTAGQSPSNAGFRQYVASSQVDGTLWQDVTAFYALQGDWQDVEQVFASRDDVGRGQRRGAPKHILADADGFIIYDEGGTRAGERLSPAERQAAMSIEVDGEKVGYFYALSTGQENLAAAEQTFLAQVNRALLQAGVIAGVLGIVLGLLLARSIAAPLGQLATAAHRFAQGELDERVPVQGSEEMAEAAQAFNDMAASLEQAEILRRNLVADIADELRTPLTVIQGNLQAILDDVYPLKKARNRHRLRRNPRSGTFGQRFA